MVFGATTRARTLGGVPARVSSVVGSVVVAEAIGGTMSISYMPCFACQLDRHELCVPSMKGHSARPPKVEWELKCGCECRKEAA